MRFSVPTGKEKPPEILLNEKILSLVSFNDLALFFIDTQEIWLTEETGNLT